MLFNEVAASTRLRTCSRRRICQCLFSFLKDTKKKARLKDALPPHALNDAVVATLICYRLASCYTALLLALLLALQRHCLLKDALSTHALKVAAVAPTDAEEAAADVC